MIENEPVHEGDSTIYMREFDRVLGLKALEDKIPHNKYAERVKEKADALEDLLEIQHITRQQFQRLLRELYDPQNDAS